jgi:hypothetical protein
MPFMYGYGKLPKNLGGLEPVCAVGAGRGQSCRGAGKARSIDRPTLRRAIGGEIVSGRGLDERTVPGGGDLEDLLIGPLLLRLGLDVQEEVAACGGHVVRLICRR